MSLFNKCLSSKKKVSTENDRFLTCFRGGPILRIPLLLSSTEDFIEQALRELFFYCSFFSVTSRICIRTTTTQYSSGFPEIGTFQDFSKFLQKSVGQIVRHSTIRPQQLVFYMPPGSKDANSQQVQGKSREICTNIASIWMFRLGSLSFLVFYLFNGPISRYYL